MGVVGFSPLCLFSFSPNHKVFSKTVSFYPVSHKPIRLFPTVWVEGRRIWMSEEKWEPWVVGQVGKNDSTKSEQRVTFSNWRRYFKLSDPPWSLDDDQFCDNGERGLKVGKIIQKSLNCVGNNDNDDFANDASVHYQNRTMKRKWLAGTVRKETAGKI